MAQASSAGQEDPPAPDALDLYRPNVGIVLANPAGMVWLGRRADAPGPSNWQFPQGGVDPGEDLLSAALRELREETGAVSARLLGRTYEWVAYDFPPEHKRRGEIWIGQKQIWFALRFTGEDAEFDLAGHGEPEFDAWTWADLDGVMERVVVFKRPTYRRAIESLRPLIAAGA